MMKLKVVLVDDDPVVLYLHQVLLKRSGLPSEVFSFRNGREALDFLSYEEEPLEPILVLLDINMPVMNGWEFLDAIQKHKGKEQFFVGVVSSSINSQDLTTSRKYCQVIDYLEKPVSKEAIQRLQKKVVGLVPKDR